MPNLSVAHSVRLASSRLSTSFPASFFRMKRWSLTSKVTPTPLKFKNELCRERPKGTPYYYSGYTMFRGSVKDTGYPLFSTVSPSLHLPASPCTITFQLHPTDVNSQYPYCLPTTQTPLYNPQTLYFPALIVCV